jgi:hypothetical protein
MDSPNVMRHTTMWRATRLLAVGVALTFAGCAIGSDAITADTMCSDYLDHPGSERQDAAVRLSAKLANSSPGNPMWGLSLDAACGSSPSMTIGEYFSHGS